MTITHEGRKLVGSVYLKGDEAGAISVRLQPWGTVTGRVVDEDGQPRKGVMLYNRGGFDPQPPADQGTLPQKPRPGTLSATTAGSGSRASSPA